MTFIIKYKCQMGNMTFMIKYKCQVGNMILFIKYKCQLGSRFHNTAGPESLEDYFQKGQRQHVDTRPNFAKVVPEPEY